MSAPPDGPATTASPGDVPPGSIEEAEARYREAFGDLADGVLVLQAVRDASGTIIDEIVEYANPAWRREMLGKDAADPVGRSLLEVAPPLVDGFERHAQAAESGTPYRSLIRATGGDAWFDVQFVKLGAGLLAMFRNVTRRVVAERALDETEARFREAFRTIGDMVVFEKAIRDATGEVVDAEVTYANAAWRRVLLGDEAIDPIGWRLLEHFPAFADRLPIHRQVIATGVSHRVTMKQPGSELWHDLDYVKFGDGVIVIARDVTDAMETRATLARSEALLRERTAELEEAREIAQLGIWRRDLRTGTTSWSREMFLIFGLDPSLPPPSPETLDALLTDDSRARRDRAAAESIRTGKPVEVDLEIRRPNGETRWVTQRAVAEVDETGAPVGFHGTALDITARRRSETELRRLAAAVEQSGDSIVVTDVDADIVYVNPAFERETGYTREEVTGHNPRVLQSGRQPASFYHELWATLVAGRTWRGEFTNRRKDGTLYQEDASITPVRRPDGSVVDYVAVKRNVTAARRAAEALRESEERYRLLADNAFDVIWTMTPEGRTTFISPSVERVRGFTPDDALAQPIEAIHPPESAAISLGYFRRIAESLAIGRQPERFRGELEYYRADGSTIWCDVELTPRIEPDGTVVEIFGVSRDITERRRAEQALRSSEARYAELAARLPVVVYVARTRADGTSTFDFMSPQAERILGIDADAAVRDAGVAFAIVEPDDLPALRRNMVDLYANRSSFRWDGRVLVRGEVRFVRVSSEPGVFDGQTIVSHGFIEDVTEQRRAEEEREAARAALARSEAQLRMLFDSLRDPAVLWRHVRDEAGGALGPVAEWTNTAFDRQFGSSGRVVRGLRMSEIDPAMPRMLPIHEQVLATGVPQRRQTAAGTDGWFDLDLIRFGDDRILVLGRDITELRRAQELIERSRLELAEAQRVAHVGSWSLNPATNEQSWSDELFRIYGLEPGSAVPAGRERLRYMRGDALDSIEAAIRSLLETGEPYELEFDLTRPDGTTRHVVGQGEAVIDERGAIVGIHGTVTDITEQHERREARARQVARRADYLARVEHTIRTNLSVIEGWSELLADGFESMDPASRQAAMAAMGRNAHALAGHMRGLMTEEAGSILAEGLEPVPVDVAAVARDVVADYVGLAGDVSITSEPPSGVLALGTRDALDTVIRHLVENAVRFAQSAVEILIAPVAPGGVEVVVLDDGPGLPMGMDVFAAYASGETGLGHGLGLHVVRTLVEAMGGTVTARDRADGTGAEFTVTLAAPVGEEA